MIDLNLDPYNILRNSALWDQKTIGWAEREVARYEQWKAEDEIIRRGREAGTVADTPSPEDRADDRRTYGGENGDG